MDKEGLKTPDFQDRIGSISRFLGRGKYSRIINMARTPTDAEYKRTIVITGIGIIILGAIGFFIMWLTTYVPRYF